MAAALEYAAHGWPVFPCRHDKAPYTPNSFLDATTDPAAIEKMWAKWPGANIGFEPGAAGMLVLDYDPGFRLEELEKNAGPIPETPLRVLTPRGGSHEYFGLADGEIIASTAGRVTPHCDVRSFHGYVLLPPSATKDGTYTWAGGPDGMDEKPTYRTDKLAEKCNTVTEKHADWDTWIIEPDLPENVDLATAWLKDKAEIAISGRSGDMKTYATAAMCKGYGISEGTTLELMWEHWNDRCQPEWSYDDLAVKVKNGHRYNQNPPGKMTPAYHVALVASMFAATEKKAGAGRQVTVGPFRFINGSGLKSIEPPAWLIPGVLPEDAYGMLVGPSGSYKTFIALDMALTIATGGGGPLYAGKWKGLWSPPPGGPRPVLFSVGEGWAMIRQRAEAWMLYHFGHTDVPDEFILTDPVPHIHGGEEAVAQLAEGARKYHEGYALVVLDTVARAMQGVSSSADEHATGFTRMCDLMRRQLGASILALHHTGHDNQERGRGSSAFIGDPDVILSSVRAQKELTRMTMPKQKDAPAWEKPVWVQLETVPLDGERESLVALLGEPPAGSNAGLAEAGKMAVIARFVLDFLRTHADQEYPTSSEKKGAKGLAEQLPGHEIEKDGEVETLGIAAGTLRKKEGPATLLRLADPENKQYAAQKMYRYDTGMWRYSAVHANDFTPL